MSGLPKPALCLEDSMSPGPTPTGLIALQLNTTIKPAKSVVPAAILNDPAIAGVQIYIDWSASEPGHDQFRALGGKCSPSTRKRSSRGSTSRSLHRVPNTEPGEAQRGRAHAPDCELRRSGQLQAGSTTAVSGG